MKKNKPVTNKIIKTAEAAPAPHVYLHPKYDPRRLVFDLFTRYKVEVSPKKRGMRWEILRLDKICREYDEFTSLSVSEISAPDVVWLREKRLELVQGSSVRREMTLMSHVFNTARDEWHWIEENPMDGVRRPEPNLSRERLFIGDELERLLNAAGYSKNKLPANATQRVGLITLFAIETAMRAGEICRIEWKHVYLNARYIQVNITKNGKPRKVPLSPAAIELLRSVWPLKDEFNGKVFGVTASVLDTTFRKVRNRAGIENLHFHDTRHEATTRLSKKLKLPALMKTIGITDPRILMIYYNETVEEIAKELAQ